MARRVSVAEVGLGSAELLGFVVQRLKPGLTGDGLGEPANAEEEEEDADDQLQPVEADAEPKAPSRASCWTRRTVRPSP